MIRLTFELFPEDSRIKPYDHPYGYIFRGVIMKWLHETKPELVHTFHEIEKVRRYAINFKIHKEIPKIDFSIISFDEILSETIMKDLLTGDKVKLTFGQKDYYISKVEFERINLKLIVEKTNPIKRFNINFVRPVYFNANIGDFPVRFPNPGSLFGNLSNLWNDISKDDNTLDRKSIINWVNAHVYVSGYNMKTVQQEIGKEKPVAGGIGNASYSVSKINKNYYKHYLEELNRQYDYEFVNTDYLSNCRWLEILCKLGEYTNVGANRTAGMGVMRYYPKEYITKKELLKKE